MDTDQISKVEIDLGTLDRTRVDGHGDVFSISPNQWNTLNVSGGSLAPGYGTVPPMSAITWPNNSPSWTFSDLSITSPPQAKIELRGEDADIEINGDSVVGMLREIRDRLNILRVSEEMEAEWDDLRALREQYAAKLAECREKSRAWAALKQQG
jgi:hypothetical protein